MQVFIVSVLAILPLVPRHISNRAYRLSLLGTACSSLYSLYTLYGVFLLLAYYFLISLHSSLWSCILRCSLHIVLGRAIIFAFISFVLLIRNPGRGIFRLFKFGFSQFSRPRTSSTFSTASCLLHLNCTLNVSIVVSSYNV